MTDSMHIVKNKVENLKPELFKKKKLSDEDIKEKSAKNLTKHVSHFIGTLGTEKCENLYFDKTIILKEDNENQLENRLQEIMKFEDEKIVVFGLFSLVIKREKIIEIFTQVTKSLFKKERQNCKGRIWCLEINGTGKGCGVIAADDKIWTWKDTVPKKAKKAKCIKVSKKADL